jgi:hypothetical protein
MTLLDEILELPYTEEHKLYYLIAPATGSNTLSVSFSGTTQYECNIVSYTGVLQSSPIETYRQESDLASVQNYSESITSSTDNCWAIWATRDYSGRVPTAGADTALVTYNDSAYATRLADSGGAISPAGTRTMNLSSTGGSGNWYTDILAVFKPVASTDVAVTPSAVSSTFGIPSPTITAVQNTSTASSVLSATFSIPTPTVTASKVITVTPDALSATFTIQEPSTDASGYITIVPSVLVMTVSIPSPTVTEVQNMTIASSVVSATFTTPASTVTVVSYITITPDAVSMTMSIPTPVIRGTYWQDKFSVPSKSWSDKY